MRSKLFLVLSLLFASHAWAQLIPQGFLDAATATDVRGWACLPSQPFRPLFVEIYVDNQFVGSATAQLQRPDVAGVCGGNGFHGFTFNFPPSVQSNLANGQPHNIQVFTRQTLDGVSRIQLSNSPAVVVTTNSAPIGFLDVANISGLSGWACDPNNFNSALRVDFYIDNNVFAGSTVANLPREPAVGQQCGGNANHGFAFTLPQNILNILSNGQPHTISAYAINIPSGNNPELSGSPKTIQVTNRLPLGFLDVANSTGVSGWSCDPDIPNQGLSVHVYIDNQFVLSTTADLPREPAVGQQCGGNSNHGFSVNWPQSVLDTFSDGQSHTVQAYAINVPTGNNPQLSNSPKNVVFPRPNQNPKGYLDIANATLAAGWTCDPDAPSESLRVDIYIDNQFAVSTTANLPREAAVAQQCGGNPYHGFSINWPQNVLDILANGQPHSIQAYAINVPTGNNPQLSNSPQTVTVPITRNSDPIGFFDFANATVASGWACDVDAPLTTLRVDIYVDGQFALATMANIPREPAVAQQCGGTANHGWSVTWPQNILDIINNGQPHTVRAYAINVPTGNNPELSGSPKTVTGVVNIAPIGFLDVATRSSASGWACDPNNFGAPLRVDIYVNGNVFAGSATANLPREAAVGQQCGGNVNAGWTFTFPANIQQLLANGGTVYAYAINIPNGNNPQLSNSPKSV